MEGEIVDFGLAIDFKELIHKNPNVVFPDPSKKAAIENADDGELLKIVKTIGSEIKIWEVDVVTTDLIQSVMSRQE